MVVGADNLTNPGQENSAYDDLLRIVAISQNFIPGHILHASQDVVQPSWTTFFSFGKSWDFLSGVVRCWAIERRLVMDHPASTRATLVTAADPLNRVCIGEIGFLFCPHVLF